MLTTFIIQQCILFLFMLFHDWIPIPPLNDLETLKLVDGHVKRLIGSAMNAITVFIPLIITIKNNHQGLIPSSNAKDIFIFYLMLSIGVIFSWWMPYLFGSSQKHKSYFNKFKNTHHFLPDISDHVVPNTLHVILHIQVWVCLAISIYFLLNAN